MSDNKVIVINIIKENLIYDINNECYNVAEMMIKLLRCISGNKVDKDYIILGIDCIYLDSNKEIVKQYFKSIGVI